MDIIIVGVVALIVGHWTGLVDAKRKALKLIRELWEDDMINTDVLSILRRYITIRLR